MKTHRGLFSKRTVIAAAAIALSLLMPAAVLAGQGAKKAKTRAKARQQEQQKEVLTGSHIPQKVKRAGHIAVSASPVTVIDRQAIERTGAASLSQILTRAPGGRR
jgi:outer membrane cobalamin receptor